MKTCESIINNLFTEYFIIPINFEEIKKYKNKFGFFLSLLLVNSPVLFDYLVITRIRKSLKHSAKENLISSPIGNAEFIDKDMVFIPGRIVERKNFTITNQELRKIFTNIFNEIGKGYDSDSDFWAKSEEYFTMLNKLWPDD